MIAVTLEPAIATTRAKGALAMKTRVGGLVLLACFAAACGKNGRPEPSHIVVSDSAGVTIVDNGALDSTLTFLVSADPILEIGVRDGPPELQFFQVSDVKRLSDGGVAVANAGSRELRLYNADGTHRATAGGAGNGPGEFRFPGALTVLAGDTVQVQDIMDRVYFTAGGTFIRRETLDLERFSSLGRASGGMAHGGSWMADGSLVAFLYHRETSPPVAGPLFRPAITIVRVARDFASFDTLGVFGGILQQFVDVGGRRGVSATVPPFATNTSWALGSADASVVVGDNASPQISRFAENGSQMVIRWASAEEPVSRVEVEEWKERQRNAEWTRGQLPELERAWAKMDVPETKPYYNRVRAGSDGTVWVTMDAGAAEVTSLRAFSSDGTYLGRAEIPSRFTPFDSGPGWLLGVSYDENDVESIRMFALRPL